MDFLDVKIPTFINPHMFWIIEKRNLLFRTAISRRMTENYKHKIITDIEKMNENKSLMVALNVDGVWARATVYKIMYETSEDSKCQWKCLCWLIDYGIPRLETSIFHLPDEFKNIPAIAKQASLYNVVNVYQEFPSAGTIDMSIEFKKTINHCDCTRKVALELIQASRNIHFAIKDETCDVLYGDIYIFNDKHEKMSLSQCLIARNLMDVDREMFKNIPLLHDHYKEMYLKPSQNWNKKLDKINLSEIIFNDEENSFIPMEYFTRRAEQVAQLLAQNNFV